MKHIKLFEQFVNESDHNVWEPVENEASAKAYKSRSGNYIINITSKKIDGTINKIVKNPKAVEGDGYQILADDKGSIVCFELTEVAEEAAKLLNGEVVSTVNLENGSTESNSSRGGSFIIIK